jgi:hypothetical protein
MTFDYDLKPQVNLSLGRWKMWGGDILTLTLIVTLSLSLPLTLTLTLLNPR